MRRGWIAGLIALIASCATQSTRHTEQQRDEQTAQQPGASASSGGITRPVKADQLVGGQFVAYTLLWQVSVPGGDPIVFRADGRVENARAGLAGTWRLLDDTTLVVMPAQIGPPGVPAGRRFVFVQRRAEDDFAATEHQPYWIRRAGTNPPR